MNLSIRESIIGGVTSISFSVASIPLERVNAGLTTVSLAVGIVIGGVTLYRIFAHKDTQAIKEDQANLSLNFAAMKAEVFSALGELREKGCNVRCSPTPPPHLDEP